MVRGKAYGGVPNPPARESPILDVSFRAAKCQMPEPTARPLNLRPLNRRALLIVLVVAVIVALAMGALGVADRQATTAKSRG